MLLLLLYPSTQKTAHIFLNRGLLPAFSERGAGTQRAVVLHDALQHPGQGSWRTDEADAEEFLFLMDPENQRNQSMKVSSGDPESFLDEAELGFPFLDGPPKELAGATGRE